MAMRQQSRKKTPQGKVNTKAKTESITKKKPEWSPYLTEDNKFALSKDELLRRKLSLISRHNLFNGELACVDTDADYPTTPPTKGKHSIAKGAVAARKSRKDRDTLDLVSSSKIETSLEENEKLELELDLGDSDEEGDDDDDDDSVLSRLVHTKGAKHHSLLR